MSLRPLAAATAAILLSACASTGARAPAAGTAAVPSAPALTASATPPAADRAAILAMAGDYRVRFNFDETVVLADGYERTEPKRSGALETVLVIDDEPGRIVLQHLLISQDGSHVTKHWRQDWYWQASERLEFSADQTWRVRDIEPTRVEGSWTQCVFEVSDAPRYCGTGRWNHKYGVATWTSDRSWRPLPRREYTTREDYNALNVENRHTIVPDGWTHEQDNTKTVRDGEATARTLVREYGFNDYHRVDDVDFEAAHSYWRNTADYWARVRQRWQRHIDRGGLHLDMPVDGMPMIEATFGQAERAGRGEAVTDRELDEIFDRHVRPLPRTAAVAATR